MKTKTLLSLNLLFVIPIFAATAIHAQGLATPQIKYVGSKEGTSSTNYQFSLVNRAAYPKELFSPAPELPACGKTQSAWRAWVKIYDKQTDKYLYGYCGESGYADPLSKLMFSVDKGSAPPKEVYMTITDRKTGAKATSNSIAIPASMNSTITTAGPALQTLIDLSMREALYFTGAKADRIDTKTDRYVTKGGTMQLRSSEAKSCSGGFCEFNIGFIGFRSGNPNGVVSSYGLFQVEGGGLVGNTVYFADKKTTQQGVLPVKLRTGMNKVTFTIDPYKKTSETNEANNSITVNFNVAGKQ
jgi:hypothetical protein